MSNRRPNNNDWLVIIGGMVLVLATNVILSFLSMYTVGYIAYQIFPSLGYNSIAIGFSSVWISQLLYVIPLILYFKRERNDSFVKGIIIGAVITALIAGFCFVQFVAVSSI